METCIVLKNPCKETLVETLKGSLIEPFSEPIRNPYETLIKGPL